MDWPLTKQLCISHHFRILLFHIMVYPVVAWKYHLKAHVGEPLLQAPWKIFQEFTQIYIENNDFAGNVMYV